MCTIINAGVTDTMVDVAHVPSILALPTASFGLVTSQKQKALPKGTDVVQPGQQLCALSLLQQLSPARVPREKGWVEARVNKEKKGSKPGSIPTQENCSKAGSLRVGQSKGKDEGAGEKLSQSSLQSLLPVWL